MDDRNNRAPNITAKMLEELGRPDNQGVNVLVTGSKGKGTISRLLERILRAHGVKTGLFTSPHLHTYNERIRICGEMIHDNDLIRVARQVEPVSQAIDKTCLPGDYISPMGNGLLMALLYFEQVHTEVNILECGRGARYDDVAAAKSSYAVIGTIFDEHIPYLGQHIKDVAWHKAGIMDKAQSAVISAEQEPSVQAVLNAEARLQNLTVDYVCSISDAVKKRVAISYNQKNAEVAFLSAQRILKDRFCWTTALEIIEQFAFEGCLEKLSDSPEIYIDGCIHPVCADAIAKTVRADKPVRFMVGIPDNKAYQAVIQKFEPVAKQIVLTKPTECHLPFSQEQVVFAKAESEQGKNVLHMDNLETALDYLLGQLRSDEGLYIVGTQIYLGQVKTALHKRGLI
jgi:dihydrofolate synthase/folylpolyglutamate synthase